MVALDKQIPLHLESNIYEDLMWRFTPYRQYKLNIHIFNVASNTSISKKLSNVLRKTGEY